MMDHLRDYDTDAIVTDRYTRLSDVVDQMFPPLEYAAKEADFLSDYSYFNYWKDPIAMITDEDELLKSLLETK